MTFTCQMFDGQAQINVQFNSVDGQNCQYLDAFSYRMTNSFNYICNEKMVFQAPIAHWLFNPSPFYGKSIE